MLRVFLFGATFLTLGYNAAQESSLLLEPTGDIKYVVEKSIIGSTINSSDQPKVPQKLKNEDVVELSITESTKQSSDQSKVTQKLKLSETSGDKKNVVEFSINESKKNASDQPKLTQKLKLSETSGDKKNVVDKDVVELSITESTKQSSDQSEVTQKLKLSETGGDKNNLVDKDVVELSITESTKQSSDQSKVTQKLKLSETSGNKKNVVELYINGSTKNESDQPKVTQKLKLSETSGHKKNVVELSINGSTKNASDQPKVTQKLKLSETSGDKKNVVELSINGSTKNASDQPNATRNYKISARTFDQEEKEEDLVVYYKRICDCREATRSGIYQIKIQGINNLVQVRCENRYLRGGWIIIQQRNNGRVDFFRSWNDYKHGFGNLEGEFWYGLEKIHLLTHNSQYELIIVIENFDGVTSYIKYDHFIVGPERSNYKLQSLGVFSGEGGDSLLYHLGFGFTTYDRKCDLKSDENCAILYHSAWWFNKCYQSNLNGRYPNLWERKSKCVACMAWNSFLSDSPLKSTKMMIRTSEGSENWED